MENNSILNQVKSAAAKVANLAQYVNIRKDRIANYTATLPIEKIHNPPLDPESHHIGNDYETIAYFITLEAINFGSGYFPYLKTTSDSSGYFTVSTALKNYFEKNGVIEAEQLNELTTKDCAQIFDQDLENESMRELMHLFSLSLNELGQFLLQNFNGSFESLLKEADHSAERLVELLIQIPCFLDIANYKGQKIPILKRAQITAADLSLAFSNQGIGYFKDLDLLSIFADNMIPHVLRCDGILEYHPDLATIVDQQQNLKAGSEAEVELRACSIHAIELIKQEFQKQGHHFLSKDLDYLLWNRGLSVDYTNKFPIHLTRTIFY